MSLDISPVLAEYYTHVRARRIPWEAAIRGGAVTEDQVQHIKNFDKISKSQRTEEILKNGVDYAKLVQEVLKTSQEKNRADVVQFILVWIADLLAGELPIALQAI